MDANPDATPSNSLPTWYDPFPEPRTVPPGWDLYDAPARPQASSLPDWYDPFPEPHTIPNGWDLSEILNPAPKAGRSRAGSPGAAEAQ